jgi:uncharacterized protein
MNVVLDTVILVRALLDPRSWSGTLVFDRYEHYSWIVSPAIVAEYLQTLRRPELVGKYRSIERRDLPFMLAQLETAVVVDTPAIPRVCRDPNDDKFLAAAVAGEADYIVSEDRDLLDLGSCEGVTILSAAAFLAVLEGEVR